MELEGSLAVSRSCEVEMSPMEVQRLRGRQRRLWATCAALAIAAGIGWLRPRAAVEGAGRADSPEEVGAKVSRMITDPRRARKSDPGNPDVCNVYEFHKLYTAPETTAAIAGECRRAEIGCVDCKNIMGRNLLANLAPIHEKRNYYDSRPELVEAIIKDGCSKAGKVARETMAEVRKAIGMVNPAEQWSR